jgi:hypothetical protein
MKGSLKTTGGSGRLATALGVAFETLRARMSPAEHYH